MGKICLKYVAFAFAQIRLAMVFVVMSMTWPVIAAADGANSAELKDRLGKMFYRSMTHWKYNYAKMPEQKAGVACIPWDRLDTTFLDNEIFKALGFSYSVANDDAAIRIATQGCNQMKAHYKLTDCECEPVLVGDAVVVTIPE